MENLGKRPRRAGLSKHFSADRDARAEWRAAYPLPEDLLLLAPFTAADNLRLGAVRLRANGAHSLAAATRAYMMIKGRIALESDTATLSQRQALNRLSFALAERAWACMAVPRRAAFALGAGGV